MTVGIVRDSLAPAAQEQFVGSGSSGGKTAVATRPLTT
jgi:hypothetical protein